MKMETASLIALCMVEIMRFIERVGGQRSSVDIQKNPRLL